MPGSPDNQHPRALAAAPLDKVTAQVVHLIRQIRPQVVITFDPMGGYRHPDHIAIHRATLEAFRASGDPARYPGGSPAFHPNKLYYHTFDRRFLRLAVRVMRLFGRDPSRFGRNADIDLADIASQDFPSHARIDFREVAEIKSRAAACHASQGSPPTSGAMGLFFRLAGGSETFMRRLSARATRIARDRPLRGCCRVVPGRPPLSDAHDRWQAPADGPEPVQSSVPVHRALARTCGTCRASRRTPGRHRAARPPS